MEVKLSYDGISVRYFNTNFLPPEHIALYGVHFDSTALNF